MRSKAKGFTLIELIIVMATFSIVLFGALSLVEPIRKIFDKAYDAEDVSASATNILNYLDMELRYAEHIKVQTTTPTQDDLINFVEMNYDGKIIPQDNDISHAVPASGELYILEVDNTQGAVINKWVLSYTAGDSLLPAVNNTGLTAPGTPIDCVVSTFDYAHPTVASAINKAMYDEVHFNLSIGNYVMDDEKKLVRDDAFYNAYTEVAMQALSKDNFGFTLTPYSYSVKGGTVKTGKTDAASDATDKRSAFDGSYVYSRSIGLLNAKDAVTGRPLYYKYNYTASSTDPRGYEVAKATTGEDAGNYTIADSYDSNAGANAHGLDLSAIPAGTDELTNRIEPAHVFFIYTYSGNDVN